MKFRFEKAQRHLKWSHIPDSDWVDWRWQMRQSLKNQCDFSEIFDLSTAEIKGFEGGKDRFQVRTTPYYASLASSKEERDPIRRIFMPRQEELETGLQQMSDPLAEKKNQAVPRLIHRYNDRVLFLVTDLCSVYCRFCTRKHFTGHDQAFLHETEYLQAIEYIRSHPGVCEVILSGGDPLTLSDHLLDRVLSELRDIDHVEIIRIGTRMLTVNPFRITEDLAKLLKRHAPVYVMTHFSHPRELTLESAQAIYLLADHGVPLMNQFVLLNGVNNHEAIVQALCRRLLYLRVKPYYFMQCDPSEGTDHLRTSIEDSLQIQRALWGHLSGLAMPQFVVDLPAGGGKVAMVPSFELGAIATNESQIRFFRGFDGIDSTYVSPAQHAIQKPIDVEIYLPEWQSILDAKKLSASKPTAGLAPRLPDASLP